MHLQRGIRAILTGILVGSGLTGCLPEHGEINYRGFSFKSRLYQVGFADTRKQVFINSNWRVDNFRKLEGAVGGWRVKEGSKFLGYRDTDKDGDGTAERERTFIYDLRLVHRRTSGVIWVQSFELTKAREGKKLEVFLESYVDSLSGTGLFEQGSIYNTQRPALRRYAAKVDAKVRTTHGPSNVLHAIISVVDLERKKISTDYKGDKIKVLLRKIRRPTRPDLLLLIGYYNRAADFEKSLTPFDSFVKRLRVTR